VLRFGGGADARRVGESLPRLRRQGETEGKAKRPGARGRRWKGAEAPGQRLGPSRRTRGSGDKDWPPDLRIATDSCGAQIFQPLTLLPLRAEIWRQYHHHTTFCVARRFFASNPFRIRHKHSPGAAGISLNQYVASGWSSSYNCNIMPSSNRIPDNIKALCPHRRSMAKGCAATTGAI